MRYYIKQYNRCDNREFVIDNFYLDAKVPPLKLYRVEAYLKNKGGEGLENALGGKFLKIN